MQAMLMPHEPAPGPSDPAAGRRAAVELLVDGVPIEGTGVPLPGPGAARVRVAVSLP